MFFPSMPSSIATFLFMVHAISGIGVVCTLWYGRPHQSWFPSRSEHFLYVIICSVCWSLLCQHRFTDAKMPQEWAFSKTLEQTIIHA